MSSATLREVVGEVGRVVLGSSRVVELLLATLLIEGHALIEGPPGIAKTLLAKSFARTLGLSFKRITFVPDLLPADIIGTMVYDPNKGDFYFRRGPIFANIVLADEINRAPPKTQAALLEAMQERQVSVEGVSYELPRPFMVIATQNPLEFQGTYPLPEAQLDRFTVRISLSYPDRKIEEEVLELVNRFGPIERTLNVRTLLAADHIVSLMKYVDRVRASKKILSYVLKLVENLRKISRWGPSTRAAIDLLRVSKGIALIKGRDYVIPDDVKDVAFYVLNHRVGLDVEDVVKAVENTPVPR